MEETPSGSVRADAPAGKADVSPNNPCPFLRALVAMGFVDGGAVKLSKLSGMVVAASGKTGLKGRFAALETRLVALVANGLNPVRLVRSLWSGAKLDALRDGPLDKHGAGSRILDASASVSEAELARFAGFGKDQPTPDGGTERGLTLRDITTYMDANFERAKGSRRAIDRLLMNGEWPVLLGIMGKGEGEGRYLSVAEVRALFTERRLPERIARRLVAHAASARRGGPLRTIGKVALGAVAVAGIAIVAIAEFPNHVRKVAPPMLAQILPPELPDTPATKAAYWLDQDWSTGDRHWFHHASQGTATFPVQYSWFVALEQAGLRLFSSPGLLKDSDYLERFGFIPSPKTVRSDAAGLRRFGFPASSDVPAIPTTTSGLQSTPVENFDGLPVGFARLTGVVNPATGKPEADRIGLTCAACHTGHLRYMGVSVRFDGGPGMVELRKLESATGLSILYTLAVPGRFDRFAARVLGPDAGAAEREQLKKNLSTIGDGLLAEKKVMDKALADSGRRDTEEGYGRLDALNRIGNQVFYTDMAEAGLKGFETNIHANDAPVSFPPIWTAPWFLWAQYDASIEQPLIRNAGEALGVSALLNLSPDTPKETLFRSSVALENLVRIEAMLRGPEPFGRDPKSFGGLSSPAWPSKIFADDPAWKIDPQRATRGRAVYAEICVECHLGPINDPVFDKQFPDKGFWTSNRWGANGSVLMPVQKSAAGMGTDPAQGNVLAKRKVKLPEFLDLQPARDLGTAWECPDLPAMSSTEMPFSIALMIVVDRVIRKWMDDRGVSEANARELWGARKNCPNPVTEPHYRARPLNGVWATAPYLHNGSVPSLYWMLKPAAERPKQFCMGARDYDPQQVGYRVVAGETASCATGQTLFSTTAPDGSAIPGNSVLGHSLEGSTAGAANKAGVIGRALSEDERYDLIEYLKTL